MNRLIISLVILTSSIMRANCQQLPEFTKADRYKTLRFDVAIFPESYIDYIGSNIRFSPTREQVDSAELILRTNLDSLNAKRTNQQSTPVIHKNLRKYRRQYFGYIDSQGNRILSINCFWAKSKAGSDIWLTTRVSVSDGGSYYWSVKYNLDTGQLFELSINGHA